MNRVADFPILVLLLAICAASLLGACVPMTAPRIAAVTPLPEGTLPPTTTLRIMEQTSADDINVEPTATPTPLSADLPQGNAAAIAMATDVAMQPVIENPLQFDESPVPITFDEFYDGFNLRTGLVLSDKLMSLDGKEVVMEGYMAPPLKPALDWFVLTRIRLEFCPFCSSDADWPDDIALVYLADGEVIATQQPIRIRGRMEIGSSVDPETGMVSIVRIYADEVEQLAGATAPAFAVARTQS